MTVRAFIVDDHPVFRTGLREVLRSCRDFHVEIVGEAGSARAAFPVVEREHPNLVTLDLALPGMDGISACRELRRRVPDTGVLILSVHDTPEDVLEAFAAGARGYALKSQSIEGLVTAIKCVVAGTRYVPEPLAPLVQHCLRGGGGGVLRVLSEREREVFRLASDAMNNAAIARELCISRKTVETHRHRIQRKLGLRSGNELILFAALNGLLRRTNRPPSSPPRPLSAVQ